MSFHKECLICRDTLLLPVELTCFRCYKKNQISCSSFCRVCRKCADDYLELQKSSGHRDMFKKCFFCPAFVDVFLLEHLETAFRKDYLLMSEDEGHHACPYCHIFQGDQLTIDRHLETNCPHFLQHCSCGVSLKRMDFPFHFSSCSHYDRCPTCQCFVLKSLMENHRFQEHQETCCDRCKEFIPYSQRNSHIADQCPERIVRCPYCRIFVRARESESHMKKHDAEFEKHFHDLTHQVNSLLEEYRLFTRVRNIRFLR